VDGPNSLPLKLDSALPNLGKLSACRRVARTIYMGSAPTTLQQGGQQPGRAGGQGDPVQVTQAETQRAAADSTVTARLLETYLWLLVPGQPTPQSPIV
jgi:hypothetical protein